MQNPVYLDYQATTPVDPRVFETMRPYFMDQFGNAGSVTHDYGDAAARAVEIAREQIATHINAHPSEIIFVSGATEANNLGIQGLSSYLQKIGKVHILTSQIEHKAVLDVLAKLEERGFDVTYLKPNSAGLFDLKIIEASMRPTTGLLCFMHVNNEIGVINPILEIGRLARERDALFFCDAAQSFGKLSIDVREMNIDLLSISAHKIYGPKGIGALYRRKKLPLEPLIYGGGQEQGLRSGTLPVPLIVGFGEALKVASNGMISEQQKILTLRDRLLQKLNERIPDLLVNGDIQNRLAGNLNVSIPGIDADALMNNFRSDIAVSNGSACTSLAPQPSYVLKSLGANNERARGSIRIGIGRFTTEEQIDFAIDVIVQNVSKLRNILSLHKV